MKHMIKRAMAVLLVVCMMAAMFAVPAAAESSLDNNLKLHYTFDDVSAFTPIGVKGYTHNLSDAKATFTVENGAVKNTDPMVGLKVPDDDAAKFYLTQSSGTYYLKFKVESWSSSTTATLFDMRSNANRSLAIGIEKGKLKVWSASKSSKTNAIEVSGASATNEFVEIAVSFNKDDGTNSTVHIFYKKASDSTWTYTKVNLEMVAKAGSHPRLFATCFDDGIGINVKAEIDALCVYTTAATAVGDIGTVLAGEKSVNYDFGSADSLNNFTAITRTNGAYSFMTGSTHSATEFYSAEDGVVTNNHTSVGLEVPSTDATKFDVNTTNGTYYLKFKVSNWTDSTTATLFDMRKTSYRALAIGIEKGTLKVWADPASNGEAKKAYAVNGASATDEFVEIAVSFSKGTTDSTMSIFYKKATETTWTKTDAVTLSTGSIERKLTPRFFANCFDGAIGANIAMDDFRVYNKALTESELCKVSYEVTPANYAPAMKNGAAVRLVANSQGIRFTSTISEATLTFIDSIKDAGTAVTVGTVIAPVDYVNKASEFTMEELNKITVTGTKYVNVVATDDGKEVKDGVVTFNAALVNLKGYNHTRVFAARSYVQFTVDGKTVILYSDYSEANNARSMSAVADAALKDLKDAEDAENGYTFEVGGKWSCYNEAERTALNGYLTNKQ